MELNFDDILSGKEAKPQSNANEAPKLKPSDVKQRQQSCMIHEIDKDLVTPPPPSSQPIPKRPLKISESAFPTCSASYFPAHAGQKR